MSRRSEAKPHLNINRKDWPSGEQWLHKIKYDGYRRAKAARGGKAPRDLGDLLPDGVTPSHDGRPNVSRSWATEDFPKSGSASNASSAISRTSPTVFRAAANNASLIGVGNRTSRIGVLSGSSGVGSSSLICREGRTFSRSIPPLQYLRLSLGVGNLTRS
jgi:hypothetical protein